VAEKKSGLGEPAEGLHAAQAPAVGTSAETSSVGGVSAPQPAYQQAGRDDVV